jgi:hypothetical protein
MRKVEETLVAYFDVLYEHCSGVTNEKYDNVYSG